MGKILGALVSAVFLEILQNYLRLRRGEVGPHAHVQHQGFPLGRRKLGGIAFRVAAVAIDGVQLGAGEFFGPPLLVRFLLWFGVGRRQAKSEQARANQPR